MTRPVKLTIWGAALGLLPFVVFIGATSYQVVNGDLTQYSYLNLAAIAGGVGAAGVAIALLRRGPSDTDSRPGWVLPVCVVLVLLGVFQVVRGVGVLPDLTGCVSASGSAGFCAELPEADSVLP